MNRPTIRPTTVQLKPIASAHSVEKIVLANYQNILTQWKQGPSHIGKSIPLPVFAESDLQKLCEQTAQLMKTQPPLVQKKPSCIIVGDLHGNLLNLFQIFALHGLPPSQNYIFLGNVIDYGEFSLETLTFLFALFYAYPSNVTLLRGECEFILSDTTRTLSSNIRMMYGEKSTLAQSFAEVLQYLPLAALISHNVLCGRSSLLVKYSSLLEIQSEKMPIPCNSDQNQVFQMGIAAVRPCDDVITQFLDNNQIQFYILGGESSGQGVEKFLDDRCFALSSDSWIGGAGIINIIGNQSPVFILFTPDSMLLRHNTNFTKIKPGINVLPKVTNMSVNPTAKARITIRPTAIPLRGSVRLPSLSPQPQPQTS